MNNEYDKNEKEYDVCLLLEGTYPFVSGGVSSWIHNLIKGMPELTFTAICILATSKEKAEYKYEVPDNFVDLKVIYLHDPIDNKKSPFKSISKKNIQKMRKFHYSLDKYDIGFMTEIVDLFREDKYPLSELMHGKKAWDLLVERYKPDMNKESFIDYFWTYRFTHLPIFKMLPLELPKARVYHTISTGYAGLLGVIARVTTGRPLLLTEHGIYVKERKIEISQAEWIYHKKDERFRVDSKLGAIQTFWIRMFEQLGKICYDYSSEIYTLYEGNKQLEILEGADPAKIKIIPNGISLDNFLGLKPEDHDYKGQTEFAIGFVGRVVPIKDVKTFLRACKIVALKVEKFKVYIMGPTEEDEEYYEECLNLVKLLHIEDVIEFTGKVKVTDYLPKLDAIVLTSISEAQPLVIMEANCAGVPAVASDVGSCRELIEGRTVADKALGPSGIVTKVADPIGTGEAILTILQKPVLRKKMSLAGIERVKTFYKESDLNETYLKIYHKYMKMEDLE
ncbi:Glycosyltransferase involved in cell wall bisynthesis [Maridesulfovibrio ferrireducens]|uniref:Glycosyltransferase involved in cell wall bisynthesis n=1 Tax=Maridesulfovibrio ferrireducens TaxID=246191 RepID=A0A1G9F1J8_9BACT|nr:GT4 family glycosyltransferase PelF [Maridesulfovibrio ferrireducens]SDK82240.1 Glycosyltransferase involved in cell wall bisynthesis [Maridesulfovibrio ferrireducens]